MSSLNKPSMGFWVISIAAFIWNAMGVSAYLRQAYQTDSFKAMNTPEQLEIINRLPSWYIAVFAAAVFASLLGCIFLLLRKEFAVTLFKLGLLAVIIQTVYNLFMNEGKENYGTFEYSMLLMIPIASIFLVWFSKNVSSKGWLS
ncbi:MAG: hypothetical protein ACI8RP_000442 [Urechidicola sp.]|jgi:hypothetical protein|tara:strand:+ start:3052 stop:3483 length:432 start_codon:yes stop_codon:yes gene_type:complete